MSNLNLAIQFGIHCDDCATAHVIHCPLTLQAMGGPAMMTEDQLLTLNEFAKGFTADELSHMSFTSNEVVESFGNIRGYTSQQITKLWETVKGGKSMTAFTGDDLVALGVIASGMSTTELNGIGIVAYQ
jgi:hypothetical protein